MSELLQKYPYSCNFSSTWTVKVDIYESFREQFSVLYCVCSWIEPEKTCCVVILFREKNCIPTPANTEYYCKLSVVQVCVLIETVKNINVTFFVIHDLEKNILVKIDIVLKMLWLEKKPLVLKENVNYATKFKIIYNIFLSYEIVDSL